MSGSVLVLSDLHARFALIDAQVAHAEESFGAPVEQVLVSGDFGLFGPELRRCFRKKKHRFSRPVAFVEGNHEDFRAFSRLVRKYAEHFTHLPRGSLQEFGGQRWLCIGGARYMDAWATPPGSVLVDADFAACRVHAEPGIDIVISHDCPAGIGVPSTEGFEHLGRPGVPQLRELAEELRPRLWFFGHHHRWHEHEEAGTRYVGLPQAWQGYALVRPDAELELVKNVLPECR